MACDVGDAAGMRREAELARAHGFTGKACIHPDQVAIAEEVFTPSPLVVARMRRIVEAAEEAARAGNGVITVDGRMVDRPVVERARRVLAAARRSPGADV
jgi:citrate lyase beta subunit